MELTLNITGMTCNRCVAGIQSTAEAVSGVANAVVQLQSPQLVANVESEAAAASLMEAIGSSGKYRASRILPGGTSIEISAPVAAATYFPLMLILAFIAGACVLLQLRAGVWSGHSLMNDFMGLFFVAFSFFKLLNLREFAATYQSYDILAARWKSWGLIYPFVELLLGITFLLRVQLFATNIVTLILMLVGTIGVVRVLRSGQKIQCACLGTVFNLPMSVVTIIEDLGMAAMALVSLVVDLS